MRRQVSKSISKSAIAFATNGHPLLLRADTGADAFGPLSTFRLCKMYYCLQILLPNSILPAGTPTTANREKAMANSYWCDVWLLQEGQSL